MMKYKIPILPLDIDLETSAILKKVASARSALGELKGVASSIPNESILINTLSLQEAKDSSEIENIFTTQDELYRSNLNVNYYASASSKEVHKYGEALQAGFKEVKTLGSLSCKHIKSIQSCIDEDNAGFRIVGKTEIKNSQTGETIYTPPQHIDEINELMSNLEQFINDDTLCDWDPLVKMAIIHHQFESIHPFYDGNGRTGRIINILYLVKEGLLSLPILYISRYINQHKSDYYELLQKVRDENAWEQWILFMLDAIEQTSLRTIGMIKGIKQLMQKHKQNMRDNSPKIYSQELLNNIFFHVYTKIDFVTKSMMISRPTASKYLGELERIGIVEKKMDGKEIYFINKDLVQLLSNENQALYVKEIVFPLHIEKVM